MKSYTCPADTDAAVSFTGLESEGEMREKLAAYFLTAPHPDYQTDEQRKRHRAILRRLMTLENRSVMEFAGMDRPFVKGDLAALLRNILEACAGLSEARRPAFTVHLSREYPARRMAGFEPRLIQMGVAGLVRAACSANPDGPVSATLYARPDSFTLAVTGELPAAEPEALGVAKEAARLHEGSLAVCGGTTGLSLRTTLPGEAGRYASPTVSELLRDTLSCVQIGFYSSLG